MVKCRCCNNKQLASRLGTIVSHQNIKEHKKNLPAWEAVEVDADAPFSFEEEDDNTVLAPLRTTESWRSLSSSPGQADAISEWTKLAHLVLVQVHGSCKDERISPPCHTSRTNTATSLMSRI